MIQGEIVVVSNEFDLPIDKTLLRKSLRYLDSDRLPVRDEKYLRDFDINFMFDQQISGLNKEKGQQLVELSDGTAIVDIHNTRISMDYFSPMVVKKSQGRFPVPRKWRTS